METTFIMFYDIKTSNDIIKRGPSDSRSLTRVLFLNVLYIGTYWKLSMLLMTCLVVHVRPQSHNWNIFKCCLPADATYQISGFYAWWFQTRTFFYVFTICKAMYDHEMPHSHIAYKPTAP